jgi:hypothetical protein
LKIISTALFMRFSEALQARSAAGDGRSGQPTRSTSDASPERLREALSSGVSLPQIPLAPDQLYRALVDLLGDHR